MVFLQADQRIAVFRADGAGVLVGHVDAAIRQADIVDDVVELRLGNDLTHGLLDLIEQSCGFLDARAGLRPDVHQNLAGIDGRKEVLAKERLERE